MFIDTHAHLQHTEYLNDPGPIVERAKTAGVERIITIGTDISDSRRALAICEKYPGVYCSAGVHPNDAGTWDKDSYDQLKKIAADPGGKVVTIGETGLDFHYSPSAEDKIKQEYVFREHIRLAGELSLSLMVHTRDAHQDTLRVLKEENACKIPSVIHCYTGGIGLAEQYLALGCVIAVGGIITFGKKARELEETGQRIPLEKIVLETDCPWLAPAPLRGKQNEPSYLVYTAERLASLRGVSRKEIEDSTTAAAEKIFKFKKTSNHGKKASDPCI